MEIINVILFVTRGGIKWVENWNYTTLKLRGLRQ